MSQTMPMSRGMLRLPIALLAALAAWPRRRAKDTATLRHLQTADDHLLRDIGLTRHDLDHPPRRGYRRGP